ncbi:hypothetical protein G9C98_003955 [Cotesia typhae]|uniref:WD repeat-containing protein 37 n=1 Tax=Cotesia typhae TaxID=2053667 RepID=A0A8J5V8C7_9HYME|nr:hypothetical protein G9C98_003955 [Cotesia typhae]
MPGEPPISTGTKSSSKVKRISIPRVQSSTDTELQSQLSQSGSTPLQPMAFHHLNFRTDFEDSSIPPAVHSRLFDLFQQIHKEFEMVYLENIGSQTSKIVSSFKNPTMTCTMHRQYAGHKDGVWEVSVGRPGQPIIATASADHTARVIAMDSGRCLLQYIGHSGSVNSIRFHPTIDLALTASGDCTAHIWQAAVNWDVAKRQSSSEDLSADRTPTNASCLGDDNEDLPTLRTPVRELLGHSGVVMAADWLPGADQLVTASWDRTANLYDTETGEVIHTLCGHDQELTAVTSAVFTREDKIVSGSDDRSVKVWELRNIRSPLATIRGDSAANRLAVSSNGVVAIPHDNRQIRLFDLSGQRLARLPRTSRRGHRRMVCAVAWAEEPGSICNLFSCGFDRLVLGWNVLPFKDV